MAASKRSWLLQEFSVPSASFTSLALWNESGRIMATGGDDGIVNLWTVGTPSNLLKFRGHSSAVHTLLFSPAEESLCTGAHSGRLKIWDVSKGIAKSDFSGHSGPVTCADFHSYGDYIVSGAKDCKLKMWDTRTNECAFTFGGHEAPINAVQYSPDGRWIASCSDDCTCKIWSVTGGKMIHQFCDHSASVTCLKFHPREYLLATGSSDKTIRLYDVDQFNLVSTSSTLNNEILSVIFSQTGQCLYSVSKNQCRVHLWEPNHSIVDSVVINWGRPSDVAISGNILVSGTVSKDVVSNYVINLNSVRTSAVNIETSPELNKTISTTDGSDEGHLNRTAKPIYISNGTICHKKKQNGTSFSPSLTDETKRKLATTFFEIKEKEKNGEKKQNSSSCPVKIKDVINTRRKIHSRTATPVSGMNGSTSQEEMQDQEFLDMLEKVDTLNKIQISGNKHNKTNISRKDTDSINPNEKKPYHTASSSDTSESDAGSPKKSQNPAGFQFIKEEKSLRKKLNTATTSIYISDEFSTCEKQHIYTPTSPDMSHNTNTSDKKQNRTLTPFQFVDKRKLSERKQDGTASLRTAEKTNIHENEPICTSHVSSHNQTAMSFELTDEINTCKNNLYRNSASLGMTQNQTAIPFEITDKTNARPIPARRSMSKDHQPLKSGEINDISQPSPNKLHIPLKLFNGNEKQSRPKIRSPMFSSDGKLPSSRDLDIPLQFFISTKNNSIPRNAQSGTLPKTEPESVPIDAQTGKLLENGEITSPHVPMNILPHLKSDLDILDMDKPEIPEKDKPVEEKTKGLSIVEDIDSRKASAGDEETDQIIPEKLVSSQPNTPQPDSLPHQRLVSSITDTHSPANVMVDSLDMSGLDMNAFLPEKIESTNNLGLQKEDDDITDEQAATLIKRGLESMKIVLSARHKNLEIVRAFWSTNDIMTSMVTAVRMEDKALLVDLLNVINLKSSLWSLDLCQLLLPEINELMKSKYENYVSAAGTALKVVLRNFASVIQSNVTTPPTSVVDLSRDERFKKCSTCHESLCQIRTLLQEKLAQPGKLGSLFRELNLMLSALD